MDDLRDVWLNSETSPSCIAGFARRWSAGISEADPLAGVPLGYTLLTNGWIVPEKAVKSFMESKVIAPDFVDSRRNRKTKKRRKQTIMTVGWGMFDHLDDASRDIVGIPRIED